MKSADTAHFRVDAVRAALTRLEPEYLSLGSRNGLPSYPPSATNSLSGLTSDR